MPAAPLVYKNVHHTVADDVHNNDGDFITVHEMLSHANVQTTAQDDCRGERAKKKVVGTLDVPYR
jgi:hypothetical protein